MQPRNPILCVDSYKSSHYLQYPPGTTALYCYLESRGGDFDRTLFFGLQSCLKEYLGTKITHQMVDEARDFFKAHGEPFPEAGWRRVVDVCDGFIPVTIKAVPEGTVVPTGRVLMTVESSDSQLPWMAGWIETMLVRGVWYPTTVATLSMHAKATIMKFLKKTSDNPEAEIDFKLHDFGARGVSSGESAALGGAAHLVNFKGTDTVEGVLLARRDYGCEMAGFSIPAAEHSTITSWGRGNEEAAYSNMLDRFAGPGKIVAVVSDSYDLFGAIEKFWGGSLRQKIIDSGATVVIRPDSGNPVEIVYQTLQLLDSKFGSTVNSKGYKVLNNVRVIQGDGINLQSIHNILAAATSLGYSATNITFGMGGGLLQQVNRDTLRFAYKCSSAKINGEWYDVCKNPVTEPWKASKAGRVTLVNRGGKLENSLLMDSWEDQTVPALKTVYRLEVGYQTGVWYRFDDIRKRAQEGLDESIGDNK